MHEFSIVMSIIDTVEKEAKAVDASSVSALTLDIGTMSGVEFYALDTALEMAIKGTILENVKIVVNKIQAEAVCCDCSHKFSIGHITDVCPKCGSFFSDVVSGKDLKIVSIVVEENE